MDNSAKVKKAIRKVLGYMKGLPEEELRETLSECKTKDVSNAISELHAFAWKHRKSCPHCNSFNVIMFDSDNDICEDCGSWFPGK